MIITTYEECARDKLCDRTATCRKGKVLKLDRWVCVFPSVTMGFFLTLFPGTFIYRIEDYETAKAMGSPLPSLGEHIFLKRSEADLFLEYIREEFRVQGMQSARAELVEDISKMPKQGLFGKVTWVSESNHRYKVMMSMSWQERENGDGSRGF